MVLPLRTARLALRRFTPDDLDHLEALDADAEVMRFITGGRPTPRAELRDEVLPAWLDADVRGDGWGYWAAVDRSDGVFVGWFHLRPGPQDPPDEPELGYRLRRDRWGVGLATEGSIALLDHGFGELGARRIHASTMVVNAASRRVMEKLGMGLVRRFHADWPDRIPGDEHGDVTYAITRDEWVARRRAGR